HLADWRAHISNASRFIQHWRWRAPAIWSVNDLCWPIICPNARALRCLRGCEEGVYIVQSDDDRVADFKAARQVFSLGNLLDQRLVASVSYGHRVRASQSIVLQRHQGRF